MKLLYIAVLVSVWMVMSSHAVSIKRRSVGDSEASPSLCPLSYGYSTLFINFINYRNPSDHKSTGISCDEGEAGGHGTECDIYMEVCISPIGSRSCSLYNIRTDVIEESTYIVFSSNIGGYTNPLAVDLGLLNDTGVSILVNIWDRDVKEWTDDIVDEFEFTFTQPPGADSLIQLVESMRVGEKTWLKLGMRRSCPYAITTAAKTTPTTPPTTTPATTPTTTPSKTPSTTPTTTPTTTSTTTSTTIPPKPTTPTKTSVRTTARSRGTTTTPPPCPTYVGGYTKFSINFVRYINQYDLKATGVRCDADSDKTMCDIALQICISAIDSRACEYFQAFTNVLGESTQIRFSNQIGGFSNPLIVDLGNRTWQGANLVMRVWDKDNENTVFPYDQIDEFNYNLTDAPGSNPKVLTIEGIRPKAKTRLVLVLTVRCPEPPTQPIILLKTTTPTTTTTTATTTPATATTTATTTPATATTTPATITTTLTAATTAPTTPQRCSIGHGSGDVIMSLDFISYINDDDLKATGLRCDVASSPTNYCDIVFEICISKIGRSDCGLYRYRTKVIAEARALLFSSRVGDLANPVSFNAGSIKTWKGIDIYIATWDDDSDHSPSSYDIIDEFHYNFTDSLGATAKQLTLLGLRQVSKSKLNLAVSTDCPALPTCKQSRDPVLCVPRLCSETSVAANCPITCNLCQPAIITTTTPPTTTTTPPTTTTRAAIKSCVDTIPNCADYGRFVCASFKDWSRSRCASFCSLC